MAEMITDILKDINNDLSLLSGKYSTNKTVRAVLEYGMLPEKKFILPEGTPPYKASVGNEAQMSSYGGFNAVAPKMYVYLRQDLKPLKREQIFIQDLEILSEPEAKLFLSIKDQNIETLYPNLTKEAVTASGYFG